MAKWLRPARKLAQKSNRRTPKKSMAYVGLDVHKKNDRLLRQDTQRQTG